MRVLIVLVALSLSVSANTAQRHTPAAAAISPYTPQEQYLAKQNVGNFGCRVDSVVVGIESPGSTDVVTADDIRGSFSQVASLEWAHVAQSSFSTLDGRNDEKVLGTPGGDMGEFIQAVQSFAKVSGRTLTEEEIATYLEKYLRVMTKTKFSYQTDEKAYIRLATACGCRNLHVSEMGGLGRKQEVFLQLVAEPQHIGDPFIKFLAINATNLEINPEYIHDSLAAYHRVLWTSPSRAADKLCYLEMKGTHKEAALVNIKTPAFCTDQGLAPMVSPEMTCQAPVMINHPEAAKLLRRELVAVLTDGTNVDPLDVLAVYNAMAETNLEKFMADFGAGLPIYTVEFKASSPLLSKKAAPVEDDE